MPRDLVSNRIGKSWYHQVHPRISALCLLQSVFPVADLFSRSSDSELWVWSTGFSCPTWPISSTFLVSHLAGCSCSFRVLTASSSKSLDNNLITTYNAPYCIHDSSPPHPSHMEISRLMGEVGFGILFAGPPKPKTDTTLAPPHWGNKAAAVLSPKAPVIVVSMAWVGRATGNQDTMKQWDGRNDDSRADGVRIWSHQRPLIASDAWWEALVLTLLQNLGQHCADLGFDLSFCMFFMTQGIVN